MKEFLSDLLEEIDKVMAAHNQLQFRVSYLEELVNRDPELKREYETAKREMVRGMGSGLTLKPGLKARVNSIDA